MIICKLSAKQWRSGSHVTFPRWRSWRFHLSPAGSFKASPDAHPGRGSVDSRHRNKRGARGLGAPRSPPRPSGAVPQAVTHTVLMGSLRCWPDRPSGLWLPLWVRSSGQQCPRPWEGRVPGPLRGRPEGKVTPLPSTSPRSLRVGPARAVSERLGRWLGFTLSVDSLQLWTTAVPLTSLLAQLPRGPTLRHRGLCRMCPP